jgi:putative PEP-CTERM system TPR-repeat lipoprotein
LQTIAASDSGSAADLALISALMMQRRSDAALAAVDQLARKLPKDPMPAFLRGQVLAQGGDVAGARTAYEKALAVDAGYFAAAEGLARLDLRERKPEQARGRFESVLKARPDNAQATLAIAALDERAGKPRAEVASLLAKAVSARPSDPIPRRALVQHYMVRQDYKAALDAAQAGVAALPTDVSMLEQLAAVQLAGGQADQAIRSYTQLVTLRPKSAVPIVGLAEAHLAAGSFAAADEAAKQARALDPDSLPVLQTAVKVDLQARRFEAALVKARALQARQPSRAHGWMVEGDIEAARHNWPAAAAAYRTALQRQDSSSIAQRLHGALRGGAEGAKAEAFARDWLKSHGKDTSFLYHLASWAILDKELEVAASHLEQALRIAPDNAAVLNNLAWVQASLKRPGAVATAVRANQLNPDQPVYLDTLAFALASEGDLQRAVLALKRAVKVAPSALGLRLNLARLHLQVGDKQAAREELGELAKLGDGFPQQAEVRKLQAQL